MTYAIYRKLLGNETFVQVCVGGFKTEEEAKEFIVKHYSPGDMEGPTPYFEYFIVKE
jgi:hypothetical protein